MRGAVGFGVVGAVLVGLVGLVGCGEGAVEVGGPRETEEVRAVAPGAGEAAPGAPGSGAGAGSGAGTGGGAGGVPACEATSPRTHEVKVAVLPDDGEAAYLDVLQTATTSVRVFGYQMGYGGVLDALKAKAQAGVAVRVILDGETQRDVNEKYRVALEAAGAHVAWSDPAFSYMHAKVIVVDDRLATVSTGNYARSFLMKERNYVARIDEPSDVADLGALFDADWGKTTPDLACTRLLVAPVNAKDRVVAAISAAKTSILVESMQLSDSDVVDALLARKAAGVTVKVLLAAPSWIDANAAAGKRMKDAGVEARWLGSPGIHAKAIVVDGKAAVLGSQNMSWTSLEKNREVGVWIDAAAGVARMSATIEADFAKGTPF